MTRNILSNKFNYKTDDIIFQITDWKSYDISIKNDDLEDENQDMDEISEKKIYKKNLIIRGYGVTENGNSICIHIEGFQPYFFFKIPQDWTNKKFDEFKENVLKLVYDNQKDGLINAGIVKKKNFMDLLIMNYLTMVFLYSKINLHIILFLKL